MFKSRAKTFVLGCLVLAYSTLVACLIVLAIVEAWPNLIQPLGLARFRHFAIKLRNVPDDKLGFAYRPGITLNFKDAPGDEYSSAYGPSPEMFGGGEVVYNDHGFPRRQLSNQYDAKDSIVLIGDSFVEAGTVSHDTVADFLEPKVHERVINLGIPGYGPAQYLEVLKRYGLNHQSSHLFIFLFEGNDFADCTRYLNWKKETNYSIYGVPGGQSFSSRYYYTVRHFLLYILDHVKSITALGHKNNRKLHSDIDINTIHPDLAIVTLPLSETKVFLGYNTRNMSTNEILASDEGKLIISTFADIHLLTENMHNAYIVFVPTKTHIYADYAKKGGINWLKNRDEVIRNKNNFEEAIRKSGSRRRVEFHKLDAGFEQEAARGQLLYHPFDTHWNSRGRSVAADYLASLVN